MDVGVAIQVINSDKPAETKARPKVVYECRNVTVTPCKDLWPNRDDVEGKHVLVGEVCHAGQWVTLRTSLVIGFDEKTNCFETLNSVYRVVE